MKIYTKTGDDGTTGLVGGSRISKSDLRIDCYGTVDELNAALGWAAVECPGEIAALIKPIQNELFVIGSQLATPDEQSAKNLPKLGDGAIRRLESEIDTGQAKLAPLKQFILPGGSEPAARLHLARTICRRAERLLVKLRGEQSVAEVNLVYLNRLSDWLFVQARLANKLAAIDDVSWEK